MTLKNHLRYVVMIAVGLAAVAGVYLWYGGTYEPLVREHARVAQRTERLVASTKQARSLARSGVQRLEDVQRQIDAYKMQAVYVSRFVPTDTVRDDALDKITREAGAMRVALSGIEQVPQGVEGPYLTRGHRFTARGRYHDVGPFLTEILSMERITQIRDVNMKAVRLNADMPEDDPQWGVEAAVTLLTFSTPLGPLPIAADSVSADAADSESAPTTNTTSVP